MNARGSWPPTTLANGGLPGLGGAIVAALLARFDGSVGVTEECTLLFSEGVVCCSLSGIEC